MVDCPLSRRTVAPASAGPFGRLLVGATGEEGESSPQAVANTTRQTAAVRIPGSPFGPRQPGWSLADGHDSSTLSRNIASSADGARRSKATGVDDLQEPALRGNTRMSGPEQFGLIAAIAGRALKDGGERLGLFAVGDDD